MRFTLINNLGEETSSENTKLIEDFINQSYEYWLEGAGDSAVRINQDEMLIFFKMKEGVFIMQHPDYLSPIIKEKPDSILTHYMGGEKMPIPDNCLCNESQAIDILINYVKTGLLTDNYQWGEYYDFVDES